MRAVLLFIIVAGGHAQVSVTTYRNDSFRTGLNPLETILTPANVRPAEFGTLFSRPVDGQVYAQPLYVPSLNIPGKGIHNVVLVATEHNSVYAFDADSTAGSNAASLWHVNLTGPATGETAVQMADVFGCPSIGPEIGITGTPVIDPSLGTFYVVASTNLNGRFYHRLHALDIATGQERPGSPVVIEASVPGTGDGFSQTTVQFRPYLYKNRAGLLLLNGVIYTAWASNCDEGPYHGWLIGYDAATLRQTSIFNVSPNAFQGSIWMGGAAPAADAEGNIYVISGNGQFDADSGATDFGDTFIKLSTRGGLAVADYFTPFNQLSLNRGDIDLGSSGPILLPDLVGSAGHPHVLAGAGKEGRIYLIDRDQMGHFNSTDDSQVVQSIAGALGPVYGGAAYFKETLFFAPANDYLKAFDIAGGHLTPMPSSQSSEAFGELGATPAVSANGSTGGIVWIVEGGSGGTLHAYDATNLAIELYNSQTNSARDALGSFVKFSLPTVANGKVYVGTANSVAVFGLLRQPAQPSVSALANAATLQPGPVAPGSLISIFGFDLAPVTNSGVALSINGTACPLLFVSPEQINAQVPFEVSPGSATAVLQLPNEPPAAIALTVAPAAPGLFTIGPGNPVQSGSRISVYLTGQGAVVPPVATGSPAPASPLARSVYSVGATFGGHAAEITAAGLWPGSIGLFQVTLRIPKVRSGVYQLVLKVDGVPSNSVNVEVSDIGQARR